MFAYSDDELRQMVEENLCCNTALPPKNVKYHLRTICKIALMMRKFEKAEVQAYKNALQYVFDKSHAISLLKNCADEGQLLSSNSIENLVYFIRKFGINWQDISDIKQNFLLTILSAPEWKNEESGNNSKTIYLFSLVLKYLYRNSKNDHLHDLLNAQEILRLLAGVKDTATKTELVWTLGFVLRSNSSSIIPSTANEEVLAKLNDDIDIIIMSNSDISEESKSFLLSHINAIKSKCNHLTVLITFVQYKIELVITNYIKIKAI